MDTGCSGPIGPTISNAEMYARGYSLQTLNILVSCILVSLRRSEASERWRCRVCLSLVPLYPLSVQPYLLLFHVYMVTFGGYNSALLTDLCLHGRKEELVIQATGYSYPCNHRAVSVSAQSGFWSLCIPSGKMDPLPECRHHHASEHMTQRHQMTE